jgi:hypothetical protein
MTRSLLAADDFVLIQCRKIAKREKMMRMNKQITLSALTGIANGTSV